MPSDLGQMPDAPPEAPPSSVPPALRLREAQAWLFDLDNTLYSSRIDLFAQMDERMRGFIARFLGLAPDDAYELQKRYFREYGTSLRGLMDLHGLDPQDFLTHVHDIDLSVLDPSPQLDRALAALPGRKLIFTNASVPHAERVLRRLGVERHFEAIFDIVAADYRPKPEPRIYAKLIERHAIVPSATVMVEDMARNLVPAAALGMTTVWVRTAAEWGADGAGEHIHHVTDDLVGWLEKVPAGLV